jgi:hypothetical protein
MMKSTKKSRRLQNNLEKKENARNVKSNKPKKSSWRQMPMREKKKWPRRLNLTWTTLSADCKKRWAKI